MPSNIYQSEFTGEQMDARFAAVAELQSAVSALETAVAAKYAKPADGIPSTDMDAAVQNALAKALTAVQSLADYYTKSETDALLAAIAASVNATAGVTAASLPTASASTVGKMYYIGPDGNGEYARYVTAYDGTNYSWLSVGTTDIDLTQYATKAEVSQLDQKVGAFDETVNLASFTPLQGTVINSNGKWANSSSSKIIFIPIKDVNGSLTFTTTTTEAIIAFLTSDTVGTIGSTPAYATGETGRRTVPADSEAVFDSIPSDAAFLYLLSTASDGVDRRPTYTLKETYGLKPQVSALSGVVSQISSDVDDVQRLLGTETKTLIEPTITTGQYINQNGQLVSWSGGRMTAPIAVQKGTILRCEGNANRATAIISKTDAQSTSYQVAVAGEGSTSTTQAYNFDYTVDEDGYIIVCSLSSAPILNILTYSGALQEIKELQEDVEGLMESEIGNILTAFDNLVCVGDSLTYSQVYIGSGTYDQRQAKRTYPEVLAALCGNEYQLLGAPGDSAKHCWDTQKSNIVSKENPLAIIYLGTNAGLTDTLNTDVVGDDPENWADNDTGCYCRFVQKFQSLGYKVLLLNIWATSGTGTADLENSKAAIQHIAERFSCAVMDVPENGAMMFHYYPDLSGYNRVHYNDLGYAWFASALIKAVGSMSAEQIKLLIPNAS